MTNLNKTSRQGAQMNREQRRTRMYRQYQQIMESDFAEQLRQADEGLAMPEMPDDILRYLGNLETLNLTASDKQAVRKLTLRLLRKKGAEYVWENRVGIRHEVSYMQETFGLDWANNLGE